MVMDLRFHRGFWSDWRTADALRGPAALAALGKSRIQCVGLVSPKLNNALSAAFALNRKGPAKLLRERDHQSKAR